MMLLLMMFFVSKFLVVFEFLLALAHIEVFSLTNHCRSTFQFFHVMYVCS